MSRKAKFTDLIPMQQELIAAKAEIARLTAELTALRAGQDALVAAAAELERACDELAGTRSRETYLSMIDGDNAGLALEALDVTRANVRALTPADATAALDAKLRAERNKVRREVAAWCAHHTMEVPMDRGARKYAGMFDAGEHCGGTHQGMGYSDAILAMIEPEGK